MVLSEIPIHLRTDEETKYILNIIDTFSKPGESYILNIKKSDKILGCLKEFINRHNKPNKIQKDNGKEFVNRLIEDHYNINNISIVRGRTYHPQSKGCIEAFNKKIKRLLEIWHMENSKQFSIYSIT